MTEKNNWRVFTLTVLFALLASAAILFQGCGQRQVSTAPGSSEFPMTIIDDLGRRVTIEKAPQRIVSLAPSFTETLFALGLGDNIAGVTNYCDYPAEAAAKPKVGGFSTPSVELVMAANPNLVLATEINKDYIPQMEKAGLTVVVIESLTLEQTLEKIRLIGQITGAAEAADNMAAGMQQRIDKIAALVKSLPPGPKPGVFFEIWPDPLTTGGAKSFINSLIVAAGGENIAGDVDQDWVKINPEVVIARNPDVIISSYHGASRQTAEQLKLRKGWEQVSAIKNNRVGFIADENMITRAGPRVVDGLESMAGLIHPGLFEKRH